MTQGACRECHSSAANKTAMTFCDIDLGRQVNVPSETVDQAFILRLFRYMLKGFHCFDFAHFRVLDFQGESGH